MSTDRSNLQVPQPGQLIKASTVAALVELARDRGLPSGPNEFVDSAGPKSRDVLRHVPLWIHAQGTAEPYSILEIYDGDVSTNGEAIVVVRPYTGAEGTLLAVNEEYPLDASGGGFVKIIVPGVPYKVRCSDAAPFTEDVGPSDSTPEVMSLAGSGFARLAEASNFGEDVSWVLARLDVEAEQPTIPGAGTGCCCDKNNCPRGVDVPTALVCCKTHLDWVMTAYGGETNLVQTAPDVWVTDEPFEGDPCELDTTTTPSTTSAGATRNTYQWRMLPDHAPWGSTLELEIVDDNGCPIVCALYRSPAPFECQCTNEFVRTEFWGDIDVSQVPYRVCVIPLGAPPPPDVATCLTVSDGAIIGPGGLSLELTGAAGAINYTHGIGGSTHSHIADFTSPDWSTSGTSCTGGYDIDINKSWKLYRPGVGPSMTSGATIEGSPANPNGPCAAWHLCLGDYAGQNCYSSGGAPALFNVQYGMTITMFVEGPEEATEVTFELHLPIPTRLPGFGGSSPTWLMTEGAFYRSDVILIDCTTAVAADVVELLFETIEVNKVFEIGRAHV